MDRRRPLRALDDDVDLARWRVLRQAHASAFAPEAGDIIAMHITSRAFAHNARIPPRHACEGEDISPPLAWHGAPEGTLSLALVCADPDAPRGTFYHWAIFDMAADLTELAEGAVPAGARQVRNDFGRTGYGGPCPPRGHGPHHYHFCLYALGSARLAVPDGADCRAVEALAERHALAKAELIGLYERR